MVFSFTEFSEERVLGKYKVKDSKLQNNARSNIRNITMAVRIKNSIIEGIKIFLEEGAGTGLPTTLANKVKNMNQIGSLNHVYVGAYLVYNNITGARPNMKPDFFEAGKDENGRSYWDTIFEKLRSLDKNNDVDDEKIKIKYKIQFFVYAKKIDDYIYGILEERQRNEEKITYAERVYDYTVDKEDDYTVDKEDEYIEDEYSEEEDEEDYDVIPRNDDDTDIGDDMDELNDTDEEEYV